MLPPGPNGTITGNVYVPQTPENFTYDADGNLTNDGRWIYIWDAENRLIALTNNSNVPNAAKMTLNFAYDYYGHRISKVVSNYVSGSFQPLSSTKFVYDGWNLVNELNGTNNAVIRAYMWGTDLSGTKQAAGGVGGLLAISGTNSQFTCFDGNGNITALEDTTSSAVTGQYEYGPFGETIRITGSASGNPCRYSTKYADTETDCLYYGYRYYNPRTGRWLSRDPHEEDGGLNLYITCGNDAIDSCDLLGLTWNVQRTGGNRAHAKPQKGDMVSDLARLIGFDNKDYTKWLIPIGPTPMPPSADSPITQCSEFTIPNTIYIEFGYIGNWLQRHFGPIPAWRSGFITMGQTFRSNGYNVIVHDQSNPSIAKADLQDPNIYGWAYAGHGGGVNEANGNASMQLVFLEGEGGGKDLDATRYTPFGINFLYAYACSSAYQNPKNNTFQQRIGYAYSEWEKNVATRGAFSGVWGDADGLHTWSQIITTPGTNVK